jgi:hypothetical protein
VSSEEDPSVGRFAQAPSEVGPDSPAKPGSCSAHALSNELTLSFTVLHEGAAALHPALTKAGCHCTRF